MARVGNFQVGDVVTILLEEEIKASSLSYNNRYDGYEMPYNISFNHDMVNYCGVECVIISMSGDGYKLDSAGGWTYTDDMLRQPDATKITITITELNELLGIGG